MCYRVSCRRASLSTPVPHRSWGTPVSLQGFGQQLSVWFLAPSLGTFSSAPTRVTRFPGSSHVPSCPLPSGLPWSSGPPGTPSLPSGDELFPLQIGHLRPFPPPLRPSAAHALQSPSPGFPARLACCRVDRAPLRLSSVDGWSASEGHSVVLRHPLSSPGRPALPLHLLS